MKAIAAFLLLVVLAEGSASAQVISQVGAFLDPWGSMGPDASDMTVDGEWVYFVESKGGGCGGTNRQRISMIRTDGTGHRVIVDDVIIETLEPDFETLVDELVVSGNGQWVAFSWPHKITSFCGVIGPYHWYLVDVATGDVNEITFNGQVVGRVSLTDDGSMMAFFGYDPMTAGWNTYVSAVNPDPMPEQVTKLSLPELAYTQPGRISGDGGTFIVVGNFIGSCCPADLFVHDLASKRTTIVTPSPAISGIAMEDVSNDGSRIIYGADGFFWGVAGDGSNHHPIVVPPAANGASITGGGTHIIYTTGFSLKDSRRVPWDGGREVVIPVVGDGYPSGVTSNGDGTLVVGWDLVSGASTVSFPLTAWFETPPVLTTYGFGTPGTPITWDVGGALGDSYVLVYSLLPGSAPFKTYGTLGVDPGSLQVLVAGTVTGAHNIGQLTVSIPSSVVIPFDVDIYFQALVLGETSALSNTTAFNVTQGSMTQSLGESGGRSLVGAATPEWSMALQPSPLPSWSVRDLVEEARWRNPAFWMAELRAGRTPSRPAQHQ
jgi:hypothetical protein